MKNCISPWKYFVLLAVAALPALVTTLRAQYKQPQAAVAPPRYNFEIENGRVYRPSTDQQLPATLDNVIDVLRDRYTNANFVVSPSLAKLQVADLKLRAGSAAQDLEAIRAACDGKFDWQPSGDRGYFPAGRNIWDAQTGLPINTIGLFVVRPPARPPEAATTVEVFNLAPYFDRTSSSNASGKRAEELHHELVDQLTAIIDQTIDAVRAGNPVDGKHPTYSFHSGANLLVVVGSMEDLGVARKVLRAVINPTSVETAANPFEPANVSDFTRRLNEIQGAYKASDVMKWGTAPGYISPARPGDSASTGQPASSPAPETEDPFTPAPATPR